MVRKELDLDVGVINSHKNISWALKKNTTFYRPLRRGALAVSQFPQAITDSKGEITKPANW
jgi:hypothetical protein